MTRDEILRKRLLLQAEIVANENASKRVRGMALVRLSQTMFDLARPLFDGAKLSKALRGSCTVEPDMGSSAVYIADERKLQVFGEFDLVRLSQLYFTQTQQTITVKKND